MNNKQKKKPVPLSGLPALFLYSLGEAVWSVLLSVLKRAGGFLGRVFGFLWNKTQAIRLSALYAVKYVGMLLISPGLKLVTAFSRMRRDVREANRESGFFAALKAFGRHFSEFLFGKRGVAVTLFNYAAPIVSIVFLYNLVTYTTAVNYAVKLIVNDEFVGYIQDEQVFTEAELIYQQRLTSLGSAKMIEAEPQFSIEKIGWSETLTPYQVADLILSRSDISVEYAYGIMMNGSLMGAVTDNTSIKAALEELLDKYRTGNPDEEVSFEWEIDCDLTGLYTSDSIIEPKIIIDIIKSLRSDAQYYEVVDGDSHTLIGDKLEMTQAEIEALNPGFTEAALRGGDLIKYSVDVPYIPVSVTCTEVYDVEIPYDTEYQDTNSLYVGVTDVSLAGVPGIKTVTARVSLVNGIETKRVLLSETLVSEPESEIILRGTLPTPQGSYSNEIASANKFIWPLKRSDGWISEKTHWDGGYAGHVGVDFAAPIGTPIYAAGAGVVKFSGWSGNFGRLVIIEHDNGLRTYYAHCSTLYVSVGEEVPQGYCIGLVGMSGYTTGPHVHFEVKNGNTSLNPMKYIDP